MSEDLVVVEYKIAASGHLHGRKAFSLEETVNRFITEGYQPFGSPFVVKGDSDSSGRQAMVKWGKKPLDRPSRDVLTNRS